MILVTGTSGFIGKHLLKMLIEQYGSEQVVALTSVPVTECRYLLHQHYEFGKDFFVKAGLAGITSIIHAGAFIPKSGQQVNDWQQCNRNIINTDRLLQADFPALESVIYLSTVDVYGKDNVITEQSPVEPVSLYGQSKLYCEKMITAWAAANKKQCQVLRIGHVYGPGEEAYQKLIPLTIKKLQAGQPLQLWGSGNEIRSFIYISDVVKAIIKSLALTEYAGPVNLAGAQSITIKQLLDKLIALSGKAPVIENLPLSAPGRDLVFDNTKMKSLLLSTELPLDEGLEKEWRYMLTL